MNLHCLNGNQALNLVCRYFGHVGAALGSRWKPLDVNAIRPFRIVLTLYSSWPRRGNAAPQLPPKMPLFRITLNEALHAGASCGPGGRIIG